MAFIKAITRFSAAHNGLPFDKREFDTAASADDAFYISIPPSPDDLSRSEAFLEIQCSRFPI